MMHTATMTTDREQQDQADLEDTFTMLGELGRGGSAVVYRARDRARKTEVAVKVVRARFAEDAAEDLERLRHEARTVVRLQHPNIVRVHEVRGLADGGLAMVMQRVNGRTLKQAIRDERAFAPERVEQVLLDIGEALAFAHEHGVIHRDVKPENIFLELGTRRALLSDFGIAYAADGDVPVCLTGSAIGTPTYMAPEQVESTQVDARADLYSLGLVAWEMLTGQQPWAGEPLYQVLYKQQYEFLPSIESLRPNAVPSRLQYIVETLLAKDPAQRFQSARALLAALRQWREPADWAAWLASRDRAADAAPEQAPATAAVSPAHADTPTLRFHRPTGGWWQTPDATVTPIARPARGLLMQDDPDPEWSVEPEWADMMRSPSSKIWGGVAATLGILALGSAFVLYAQALQHPNQPVKWTPVPAATAQR